MKIDFFTIYETQFRNRESELRLHIYVYIYCMYNYVYILFCFVLESFKYSTLCNIVFFLFYFFLLFHLTSS